MFSYFLGKRGCLHLRVHRPLRRPPPDGLRRLRRRQAHEQQEEEDEADQGGAEQQRSVQKTGMMHSPKGNSVPITNSRTDGVEKQVVV
jgi:hypothetical protein